MKKTMDSTEELTGIKEPEQEASAQEVPNGKIFTQEDVNRILQGKLSQLKKQASKEQDQEHQQKMQEIEAREMRIMIKEALNERQMPKELAEIITCADEEDLKYKLDLIQKIYGGEPAEEEPKGFQQIGANSPEKEDKGDPLREAMGLK